MGRIRWMIRRRTPAVALRTVDRLRGRPVAPPVGSVRFGSFRRTTPIAGDFGYARGGPVDRVYIESFLEEHRRDVRGRVLEIGDDAYTRRFGGSSVDRADVLHVAADSGATFVGDLADGDFLPSDAFDCIVLTQTLHLVYDVRAALATVHRILAPGGVLLMTVPGISNMDPGEWGSTWHYAFTHHSVPRLCADHMPGCEVTVRTYGNVLAAVAFLHGLGAAELQPEELRVHDPAYSLIVAARVRKPAG